MTGPSRHCTCGPATAAGGPLRTRPSPVRWDYEDKRRNSIGGFASWSSVDSGQRAGLRPLRVGSRSGILPPAAVARTLRCYGEHGAGGPVWSLPQHALDLPILTLHADAAALGRSADWARDAWAALAPRLTLRNRSRRSRGDHPGASSFRGTSTGLRNRSKSFDHVESHRIPCGSRSFAKNVMTAFTRPFPTERRAAEAPSRLSKRASSLDRAFMIWTLARPIGRAGCGTFGSFGFDANARRAGRTPEAKAS